MAHVTYSRKNEKADVFATKCTYNIWETAIEIITPFGELKIITTLIGQNNVHNVLAAVATGLAMSIPIKVWQTASKGRKRHLSHAYPPRYLTDACCDIFMQANRRLFKQHF